MIKDYKNRKQLLIALKKWIKKGDVFYISRWGDKMIIKKERKKIYDFALHPDQDHMSFNEIVEEIYHIRKQ
jgi:hypothetical protein